MAETVTLAGVTYTIPDPGESPNWATGLTPYLVAIAANVASNPTFVQYVSVAASPTTAVSGKCYLINTSSLAITMNLPTPVQNTWFMFKDVSFNASANNITLHRAGSEQIDGVSADKLLKRNGGTWLLMSDGTNWYSINEFNYAGNDSGLVNADIASGAAIAYSKLALSASIVNADVAVGAAIAYSKLALTGSIVNADVAAGAAIAVSKLASLGGSTNAVVTQNSSGNIQASAILSTNLFLADGTVTATGNFAMGAHTFSGVGNGAAATPALANAANSGMYFATNLIGFAVNAANKWTMDTNGVLFGSGLLNVGDGAVGTPSMSFNSDATTGFYRNSAGVVSYAGSGVQSLEFLAIASADDAEQVPFEWFGGGNHNAGGIVKYTSTGVTTAAKKIGRIDFDGGLVLVCGTDGVNEFLDLLLGFDVTTNAPTVVGSTTKGTPAARTYTAANGQVKVTMGSGTYTVSSTTIGLNFR